ncbi:MBL fold metallo-hydrolase [Acinetobacter lwoffii]|uniref:MBL fold metallo-hydrolase n=1 Tax=Acinetobacter lwoffii TaxID=28090 RepID=UPI003F8D640A
MKWIKGVLLGLLILLLLIAGTLAYLLQASGKVSDFQAWQPKTGTSVQGLTVKFFGVSTLLLDDGHDQILIDGFFSRPSLWQVLSRPIQSDRLLLEQLVQHHELSRTQTILVTHSHYDHVLDVPALLEMLPKTALVGSPSTLNIARANPKVTPQQLQPVKPGQVQQWGNFQITAIPSQHTPPTAVNDDLGEEMLQPLTLPAKFSEFKEGGSFDYLIEHAGHKILVKASTGFIPDQFKNLQVDTLFLGIAQLSRQSSDYQQQYLTETLNMLKPKVVIPVHWDHFFQPLKQPLQFLPRLADDTPKSLNLLIQAAEAQGTKVVLLSGPQPYLLNATVASQSD